MNSKKCLIHTQSLQRSYKVYALALQLCKSRRTFLVCINDYKYFILKVERYICNIIITNKLNNLILNDILMLDFKKTHQFNQLRYNYVFCIHKNQYVSSENLFCQLRLSFFFLIESILSEAKSNSHVNVLQRRRLGSNTCTGEILQNTPLFLYHLLLSIRSKNCF